MTDMTQVLDECIRERLEYGKWILVAYGWGRQPTSPPDPLTFGIMTCSIDEFPGVVDFLTRELAYSFNFGRSIPLNRMLDLQERYSAVKVMSFPLQGFSGETNDRSVLRAVRDTCAKFAATRWLERAVALLDITGFTQVGPTRQLAYIMSLNKALNSSFARLRRISSARSRTGLRALGLSFRRSTTGDGYYIWNETWGADGDTVLLALVLQALSVLEHRLSEAREHPIRVKAAFTVGEVFCLADRGITWLDEGQQIAVGPATNYLARIMTKAVPGQVLMGKFVRSDTDSSEVGPSELLDRATRLLAEELPSDLQMRSRWRWDPDSDLRVLDKHGDAHYCRNVVVDVGNELFDSRGDRGRFVTRVGVPLDESRELGGLQFLQTGKVERVPLNDTDAVGQ